MNLPEALGRELPVWKEWMSHPDMDEFWKGISFTDEDFKRIDIPVLHITGYYDGDQPGALHYYNGAVKHSLNPEQNYMIMGPWDHPGTRTPKRYLGGVDFTDESFMEMKNLHLQWFDCWLKSKENAVNDWPLTRYFIMNENKWELSEDYWPIDPKRQPYYLGSEGKANTVYGDGKLSEKMGVDNRDTYIYNPENPAMPTNNFDFYGSSDEPPLDKRYLLRRDDHLVYTSPELDIPINILGTPVTEIYVSSDCPDTDFFVTLMEVHTDNRSILVSRGIIRARYRNGLEKQELMEKGKIYKITIPMNSTSVAFKKGHRIRLSITSSEFPRYARNSNTGNPVNTDSDMKIASNSIHHGKTYPSKILLPVI
jgi:hypothetical protein